MYIDLDISKIRNLVFGIVWLGLLGLTPTSAFSAPQKDERMNKITLLMGLKTLATKGSLTNVTELQRLLGIHLAWDEAWNPGDETRKLYRIQGSFLDSDGIYKSSSLRIVPHAPSQPDNNDEPQRAALLSLDLNPDKICLRVDDVEQVFGTGGCWRRIVHRHGGEHSDLIYRARQTPNTSIRFTHVDAECVRSISIDENCFSEYGMGCPRGEDIGIGIGFPIGRPVR